MKCPYCGKEMQKGYVISGQTLMWSQKQHRLFYRPGEGEFMMSTSMAGAAVEAGHCAACKKIVMDTYGMEK